MINQRDCFYKLTTDTKNITDYFKNNFNNLNWHEHESLWNLSFVPLETLLENKTLAKIHKQFEIEGAGFIKMDPEQCYKWHVDYSRGPAINMQMNPEIQSLCLFETEELNKERIRYLELKYQLDTFYLFNTQINHTIITFSETRYLFTLQFKKTKEELSYYDVLKFWTDLT